ncbi:LAME_0B05358g1_1 [Lachancea meyersii CBS 8951]|uniref:LAME_0B05358g1_1 n=1 Tax=Lachancea meyersii CBS 8951 TaxID=1266667 RepID=A0A1G4IVK5_9SACH|nr:LAME_0B05358g1_1 [Lachancea meyersii CBS 8951]
MSTDSTSQKNLQQVLDRKPDFTNDTPLDQFFDSLQSQLFSKLTDDSSVPLYEEAGLPKNDEFVAYLLKKLAELSSITLEITRCDESTARLVPISLHDMKYFDLLINLIVVHGVYANLPAGIGIPLEQRRIDSFRKTDKKFVVPRSHKPNLSTLGRVADVLYTTLLSAPVKWNTVGSLLLKGAGFTDLMTALIALQFSVDTEIAHKQSYCKMFGELENLQETYQLFSLYTLLVHTTSKLKYREFVLSQLATLPVRRNNGVISLIDFIVGVREDEEIDISKYSRVTQILTTKPRAMTSKQYFTQLFDQIYEGLTFVNKPILVSCLNNLVSELYFKNKRIIHDFLFKKISTVLYNDVRQEFSSKTLNDTMNVLLSISKNPHEELTNDLATFHFKNFYLTLWTYCMFLRRDQKLQPRSGAKEIDAPYYTVMLSLLKSYITINHAYDALESIVMNLVNFDHGDWGYKIDPETQLPYVKLLDQSRFSKDLNITSSGDTDRLQKVQQVFLDIDLAVELFADLLKLLNEPEVVKNTFLSVMNRWISSTKTDRTSQSILAEDVQSSLLVLVDLKLMEKLDQAFKNDIIRKPRDILTMIQELFELPEERSELKDNTADSDDEDSDSDDNDDDDSEDEQTNEEDDILQDPRATSVYLTLLKLLSTILSTTSKRDLLHSHDVLKSIKQSLERRPNDENAQSLVLRLRNFLENNDASKVDSEMSRSFDEFDADQETLQRAMLSVEDALPPIRANGLYELRRLIERKSPVIDLKHAIEMHARQLHDKEPFVYLNAIKGLSALCELDPTHTLDYLLEIYSGRETASKKTRTLDDILKIGEVLVNYVETQNELFGGLVAHRLVAVCLSNLQQHNSLDARARTSAMSLLGVCVETNCQAIQSDLLDILDCAVGVLRFEKSEDPEDISKLLRRGALHLLHTLMVQVGPESLPENYSLPQIASLLSYVRSNDPDYLVYEQAGALLQLIQERQHINPDSESVAKLHL